eukprot:1633841-Alexandrium_andersonii.AAC.1
MREGALAQVLRVSARGGPSRSTQCGRSTGAPRAVCARGRPRAKCDPARARVRALCEQVCARACWHKYSEQGSRL